MPDCSTAISAPIVVLVDGSAHSRAAVLFAGEWARETGAPLMLRGAMSVWHRSGILREHVQNALYEEMDRYAAELSAAGGGVVGGTRAIVRFGRRAGALAVAGESPLAVVLGMEGHGGWESTTRASLADEVAANVECPIIVVPNHPHASSAHGRVVVGLDDATRAKDAFAFAVFWARAHAVPVTVLRSPSVPSISKSMPADLDVDEREVSGDLGAALAEASKEAALIVIGRPASRTPGAAFHFLEPLHLEVCECPVAVVRPH